MAGTAADSLVALTNVVVRAAFPNVTVAPERNPVPFTVRVKAGPPAVAELGLRLVIVGLGLIVNVVIYPVTLLRLAMGAAERGLAVLASQGSQKGLLPQMQSRAQLYELLGYDDYSQFDARLEQA